MPKGVKLATMVFFWCWATVATGCHFGDLTRSPRDTAVRDCRSICGGRGMTMRGLIQGTYVDAKQLSCICGVPSRALAFDTTPPSWWTPTSRPCPTFDRQVTCESYFGREGCRERTRKASVMRSCAHPVKATHHPAVNPDPPRAPKPQKPTTDQPPQQPAGPQKATQEKQAQLLLGDGA